MFLAGAREHVRVDVHIERGVVNLFPPLLLFVFGKELPNKCVFVVNFFVAGKMARRLGYHVCLWQEL